MTVRSMFLAPRGIITWSLDDLASSYADLNPATQTYAVELVFQVLGDIDVLRDVAGDLLNEQIFVDPLSQAAITWVRVTHQSGDDMTAGATRGVWLQLNSQRKYTMRHISSGGDDSISGVFDLELSSDASGSPIEAQALGVTITAGEAF